MAKENGEERRPSEVREEEEPPAGEGPRGSREPRGAGHASCVAGRHASTTGKPTPGGSAPLLRVGRTTKARPGAGRCPQQRPCSGAVRVWRVREDVRSLHLCHGAARRREHRAERRARRLTRRYGGRAHHPHYSESELEPHALVGWDAQWVGTGFGLGGRISINLTHEGIIKKINNSVAIGFGLDWVHYLVERLQLRSEVPPATAVTSPRLATCERRLLASVPGRHAVELLRRARLERLRGAGLYVYHAVYNRNYPCNGLGLPPCGYVYWGRHGRSGPCSRWARATTSTRPSRSRFALGYPDVVTAGVSFLP